MTVTGTLEHYTLLGQSWSSFSYLTGTQRTGNPGCSEGMARPKESWTVTHSCQMGRNTPQPQPMNSQGDSGSH